MKPDVLPRKEKQMKKKSYITEQVQDGKEKFFVPYAQKIEESQQLASAIKLLEPFLKKHKENLIESKKDIQFSYLRIDRFNPIHFEHKSNEVRCDIENTNGILLKCKIYTSNDWFDTVTIHRMLFEKGLGVWDHLLTLCHEYKTVQGYRLNLCDDASEWKNCADEILKNRINSELCLLFKGQDSKTQLAVGFKKLSELENNLNLFRCYCNIKRNVSDLEQLANSIQLLAKFLKHKKIPLLSIKIKEFNPVKIRAQKEIETDLNHPQKLVIFNGSPSLWFDDSLNDLMGITYQDKQKKNLRLFYSKM